MGRRATGWEWTKVGVLHGGLSRREVACDGEIRSYRYRFYSSTHRFFERCIGLAWCSRCREYSGAMVHVSRAEQLTDLLDGLPVAERERCCAARQSCWITLIGLHGEDGGRILP